MVTILESPIANFDPQPDSMTIIYTTTQLVDKSEGDIISWIWDFGDNSLQISLKILIILLKIQ